MAGGRRRHCALAGTGHFEQDEWELHRYEIDRSKCHDAAVENPDRLQEMIGLWWHEAGADNVLPRDDRAALQQVTIPPLTLRRPHDTYVYYPGTAAVAESQDPTSAGAPTASWPRSNSARPPRTASLTGVAIRQALSLHQEQKGLYVYNFLDITGQQFVSTEPLGTGKHIIGAALTKEGGTQTGEFTETIRLHVDGQVVAEGRIATQPGFFSLCGEGLCVGRETAKAVSKE